MSQTIRFHLDKHAPEAIAHALRRRGVDVSTTTNAGLLWASDRDQLAYALSEGSVLVTHDPDLIALAHSDQRHAGIAYCDQERRSVTLHAIRTSFEKLQAGPCHSVSQSLPGQ